MNENKITQLTNTPQRASFMYLGILDRISQTIPQKRYLSVSNEALALLAELGNRVNLEEVYVPRNLFRIEGVIEIPLGTIPVEFISRYENNQDNSYQIHELIEKVKLKLFNIVDDFIHEIVWGYDVDTGRLVLIIK